MLQDSRSLIEAEIYDVDIHEAMMAIEMSWEG